jgi:pseudaminic acid synthase
VTDGKLSIGRKPIGSGHPPYIIAEVSANHLGDFDRAADIVRAAQAAGADAVKLQTYTADSLTIRSDAEWFRVGEGSLWAGRTLYDLYTEGSMPWEWQRPLRDLAKELGLGFLSTPFDAKAVEFLDGLEVDALKIASFELVDLELIAAAASTGRPIIMSTGMATLEEIDDAVDAAVQEGAVGLVLLRCNSAYPATPSEMDLAAIPTMIARWGYPVGLSDHSLGPAAAVTAVALGACVLEKHTTLSRADGGVDAAFSAEPEELAEYVRQTRQAQETIGQERFGPSPHEAASTIFRRSLFVVEDVEAGESFTRTNVRSIRPNAGLAPKELSKILGRQAARRVVRGTPLSWDLVV